MSFTLVSLTGKPNQNSGKRVVAKFSKSSDLARRFDASELRCKNPKIVLQPSSDSRFAKKLRLPLFFCGRRVILENQKIVSTRNLTPLFNFNFALSNSWCRRCCCLAPDFGPDNICPSDPHSLKKVADFFPIKCKFTLSCKRRTAIREGSNKCVVQSIRYSYKKIR